MNRNSLERASRVLQTTDRPLNFVRTNTAFDHLTFKALVMPDCYNENEQLDKSFKLCCSLQM